MPYTHPGTYTHHDMTRPPARCAYTMAALILSPGFWGASRDMRQRKAGSAAKHRGLPLGLAAAVTDIIACSRAPLRPLG